MLLQDHFCVLLNRYVHGEGQRYLVRIAVNNPGILSNNLAANLLRRNRDGIGSCRRRISRRGTELGSAAAADAGHYPGAEQ